MDQPVYHIPALLPQTISALKIEPDGTFVDATYGGGGHSRGILEHLGDDGHLYALDQDIEAIERAQADNRLTLIHGNFRFIANFLQYNGVEAERVDGILADLGVSFHHFDDPSRGFSFRWDGPLDMRMNQRSPVTAAHIIATYDEEKLANIFHLYGELKNGRRLAKEIIKKRADSEIKNVEQLLEIAKPLIDSRQEKKEMAQIFQALRIEVNHELQALEALLKQSLEMLRPGGRLAIITYHSLEDRLVKNFMKTGNFQGRAITDFYGRQIAPMRLVTSKPIVPDPEEIEANPRSRSAKLRVAEKLPNAK